MPVPKTQNPLVTQPPKQPQPLIPVTRPPNDFTEEMALMIHQAGTVKLSDEQRTILYSPVSDSDVEIREDGLIYLPWMRYATRLRKAFGMEWALIPHGIPKKEGNLILWGFFLVVQGKPCAYAIGEQDYYPNNSTMSYGDAIEGAKSNALMRCCKAVGISLELWDPQFVRDWKMKYAASEQRRNRRGELKTCWFKKSPVSSEKTGPTETDLTETGLHAGEPQSDSKPYAQKLRERVFASVADVGWDDEDLAHFCYSRFHIQSRAEMETENWKYVADLFDELKPIRAAISDISKKGIPIHLLRFYLCLRYFTPYVLPSNDLRAMLASALTKTTTYAKLSNAVTSADEWQQRIGGMDRAYGMLFEVHRFTSEALSAEDSVSAIKGLLSRLNAVENKGVCDFSAVEPDDFSVWPIYFQSAVADLGKDYKIPEGLLLRPASTRPVSTSTVSAEESSNGESEDSSPIDNVPFADNDVPF